METEKEKYERLLPIMQEKEQAIPKWELLEHDPEAFYPHMQKKCNWISQDKKFRMERDVGYGAPRPEDGESWQVTILHGDDGTFLPVAYQSEKVHPIGNNIYLRAVGYIDDDCSSKGITTYFEECAKQRGKKITTFSSNNEIIKYFHIIASFLGWGRLREDGSQYTNKNVFWKNNLTCLEVSNPYVQIRNELFQ